MATNKEYVAKPEMASGKPGVAMIGILVVQIIFGYQWLLSGIAKFRGGDFPSGLAGELTEASEGAAQWYANVLNNAIIPNATVFGYIIEYAEILAGLALFVGPLIWIFAWNRTPKSLQLAIVVLMIAASVGGIFMALNFHFAGGGSHPWTLQESGFDEAVDIDTIMSAIQAVITVVFITFLSRLRKERLSAIAIPAKTQVK